jgi:hypothetical protein
MDGITKRGPNRSLRIPKKPAGHYACWKNGSLLQDLLAQTVHAPRNHRRGAGVDRAARAIGMI